MYNLKTVCFRLFSDCVFSFYEKGSGFFRGCIEWLHKMSGLLFYDMSYYVCHLLQSAC